MGNLVHTPSDLEARRLRTRTIDVACGIGKRPENWVSTVPELVTCPQCRAKAIEYWTDRVTRGKQILELPADYFDETMSRERVVRALNRAEALLDRWKGRSEGR